MVDNGEKEKRLEARLMRTIRGERVREGGIEPERRLLLRSTVSNTGEEERGLGRLPEKKLWKR